MRRSLACVLCAVAVQAAAEAHVIDEYVQAAQIALTPAGARVELRLIPGVQVADRVVATIDGDGDGQIEPAEEQVYALSVLGDIALDVDGRRAPLTLTRVEFPSRQEMREGVGAIRLELSADADLGAAGEHTLTFRNDHRPELGVYLANALVPKTDAIEITGQRRDELQHELRVEFRVLAPEARVWPRWAGVLLAGICGALFLVELRRLTNQPVR